jgi:hypothetical protein
MTPHRCASFTPPADADDSCISRDGVILRRAFTPDEGSRAQLDHSGHEPRRPTPDPKLLIQNDQLPVENIATNSIVLFILRSERCATSAAR